MTDWRARAACRGAGNSFFFPADGEKPDYTIASQFCAACPVASECLDHAVAHETNAHSGFWAGTLPSDRRRIRAERRGRFLQPCGTRAAYERHRRMGEIPCQDCKRAKTAWTDAYTGRRERIDLKAASS